MRRSAIVVISLAAALLLPTAALAAPGWDCPNDASGYEVVGKQVWWDRTVAGFEAEGIAVYIDGDPANGFTDEFDAFSASAGFGDGQGLYDFVWFTQWEAIDKNADELVCMKDRPHTPGNPAYFFGGVDNRSA